MDRSCKTPNYKSSVDPGMFYTLLSRATSSDLVKIVNFTEDVVKCNYHAKNEMERLRTEEVLSCKHPLTELNGLKICLHNIRKWDKHINHFLSDENYLNHSSILCFTETHTSEHDFKDIKEYHNGTWDSVHEHRGHGFAICYDTCKVEITEDNFDIVFEDLEIFPVGMKIGNERVLLVLIYRPPDGPKLPFLYQLHHQVNRLPRHNYDRLIVLGDFNLDQRLPEHRDSFIPFCEHFEFIQRSTWSTHRYGGILDLVFDTDQSKQPVDWIPSPYSDYFVLLIEM